MNNIIERCNDAALSIKEQAKERMVISPQITSFHSEKSIKFSEKLLSSINFHCHDRDQVLILDANNVVNDKPYQFNGDFLLVNFSIKSKSAQDSFIVFSQREFKLKKQSDITNDDEVIGLFLFDFSE